MSIDYGIEWAYGEFRIARLKSGEVVESWKSPTPVTDLASLNDAMYEAAYHVDISRGGSVAIAYEDDLHTHEFLEVPPLSHKDMNKFLVRRVELDKPFKDEAAWRHHPVAKGTNVDGVILHLMPKYIVNAVMRICEEFYLMPKLLVPLTEIMSEYVPKLGIAPEEAVLMIALFDDRTQMLISSGCGEILFVRELSYPWSPESSMRLTTDINRTIGYSKQRIEGDLNKAWIIGENAEAATQDLMGRVDTELTYDEVAAEAEFWMTQVAALPQGLSSNFIPALARSSITGKTLLRTAVMMSGLTILAATLFCGSIEYILFKSNLDANALAQTVSALEDDLERAQTEVEFMKLESAKLDVLNDKLDYEAEQAIRDELWNTAPNPNLGLSVEMDMAKVVEEEKPEVYSFVAKNLPVDEACKLFGEMYDLNIVVEQGVTGTISADGWITLDVSPVVTRVSSITEAFDEDGNVSSTAPNLDISQASSLVNIAAINYHFEGKENLYVAVDKYISDDIEEDMRAQEISAVVGNDARILFPDDMILENNFDSEVAAANYQRLLQSDIDIILAFGPTNNQIISAQATHVKPTILFGAINSDLIALESDRETSGIDNFTYIVSSQSYEEDLKTFASLFEFQHLGVITSNLESIENFQFQSRLADIVSGFNASHRLIRFESIEQLEAQLTGLDSVYIAEGFAIGPADIEGIARLFIDKKLPSFTSTRREDVEIGLMATKVGNEDFELLFRRIALGVEAVIEGRNLADQPVFIEFNDTLTVNYNTSKAVGVLPKYSQIASTDLVGDLDSLYYEQQYSIQEAVQVILEKSLSLQSSMKDVEIAELDVNSARTNYHPNISLNSTSTYIDPDLSAISSGQAPERSTNADITVSQTLYSQSASAGIGIQKRLRDAQWENYYATELDLILDAATASIDLLSLKRLMEIELGNLEVTRRNLRVAQQNFEAGQSSKSDIFRFQSELANNMQGFIDAIANYTQGGYRLNTFFNNPIETGIDILDIQIENGPFDGFGYAQLAEMLDDPRESRMLGQFLVEEALANAPELKSIEHSLDATEIDKAQYGWRRFIPTVSAQAQYNELIDQSGVGVPSTGAFVEDDYNVALTFSIPLYRQNTENVARRSAELQRQQLVLNRAITAQNIETQVRNALQEVTSKIAGLSFAIVGCEPEVTEEPVVRPVRAIQVQYGGEQVRYGEIYSPEDGIISAVYKEVDENASTGETIAILNAGEDMEIEVGLPESLINRVSEGLVGYQSLSRDSMPPYTVRVATVVSQFPGASPERVELLVTEQVEEVAQELPELKELNSTSRTGMSIVTVTLKDDVDAAELQPVWDRLRRKLEDLDSLPDGVLPDLNDDGVGDVYGIVLALTTDGFSYAEMKEYADAIRDDLIKLDAAAKVELGGVQEERIFIEFDIAQLSEYNISATQLQNFIQSTNILSSGGQINLGSERIILEPTGNYNSIEDIAETLVPLGESNQLVYLGDITDIRRGYIDPPDQIVRANGMQAISLHINVKKGENISKLGEEVDRILAAWEPNLPIGLELKRAVSMDTYIEEKVSSFIGNLVQAIVIILLVMLFFLGIRTGFIIASLIPAVTIMTLMLMGQLNVGLNQVTLAALIMALGMMVDNAIVVAESVMVKIDQGMTAKKAAIDSDRNLITLDINLGEGTRIERTQEIVEQLEAYIADELLIGNLRDTGIVDWTAYVGQGPESYDIGYSPDEANDSYAHILINTSSYLDNNYLIDALDRYSFENFPDATIVAAPLGAGGTGTPIEIKISGDNPDVANILPQWQYAKIKRTDLVRTINVSSELTENGNAAAVMAEIQPWLDQEAAKWPEGYSYDTGGDAESTAENMGAVVKYLPLAGAIILFLLVLQFNSFRKTLLVLMTIPMGLIGVSIGLLLLREPFGFMPFLGVISLSGIVINNAIVLLDRMDVELARNGRSIQDAVVVACLARFRPILLATFTTVLGMIPLYLSGGEMWEGMAVCIMFGLLFGTLITLLLVPSVYSALYRVNYTDYRFDEALMDA
eukprot:g4378.t1